MSVPTAVSLEAIHQDLVDAAQFAASAGLVMDTSTLSEDNLRFYTTFENRSGEKFYAEFNCLNFPLHPPTIEFTDVARQARGMKHLYPNVFHGMPCVCMRYNRKAYGELGGPHGEWRVVDWHLPTDGGGPITTLAMIISDMHTKILDSTGRMS
jgi:hypothetical protein